MQGSMYKNNHLNEHRIGMWW